MMTERRVPPHGSGTLAVARGVAGANSPRVRDSATLVNIGHGPAQHIEECLRGPAVKQGTTWASWYRQPSGSMAPQADDELRATRDNRW